MNPFRSEQRLWLAVVAKAAEDLFFSDGKMQGGKYSSLVRKSAYSFLFSNAPSLARYRKLVFENAGLNPKYPKWRELRKQADEFELNQP